MPAMACSEPPIGRLTQPEEISNVVLSITSDEASYVTSATTPLAALKAAGLVQAKPDPKDGRKSLMSATPAGPKMLESLRSSRGAWLMRAIDATVGADERASLDKAIELLERLADADLSPEIEIR